MFKFKGLKCVFLAFYTFISASVVIYYEEILDFKIQRFTVSFF